MGHVKGNALLPVSEIQLPRVETRFVPECATTAGRAVILSVNVRIDIYQAAKEVGDSHIYMGTTTIMKRESVSRLIPQFSSDPKAV